ncbi:MAG: hypothetical protein HXX15_03735 [Rhodopseudomonas sp.]|uniref:N-acyl amino acid synthase FeeM domain-containing protein n=1 Tax=Rhodopseudomonas sp. TaxID=1078 RepID=UPI0017E0E71E|nr:acyl-homoserine-lactone synthase [Rhodopseudomonas sp.]NVN85181.1 hypothetical protein [Rhodopseudomonas sp.]
MSSAQRIATTSAPSSRGLELFDQVDYRLAETEAEKDAIYRLRYRAYLKEGTIEPNCRQTITDRFDDLDNSWIFGVYLKGALASSLRITVASPENPVCPSMDVFSDLLEPELAKGKIIVDPTRFVADPLRADRFPELPYITLRLAFVACAYFNADIGLATVRAEHQAFYRRMFMHEAMCPPRRYPGLTKSIAMMAVNYPAMRDKVFARYPFLRSTLFERRMLFERASERSSPSLHLTEFPADSAAMVALAT